MTDSAFDRSFLSDTVKILCGADEAGRGPLAGPVVAGACILSSDNPIEGLDDSKKLSEKKRASLFDEIKEKAVAYGIGIATPEEIDEINILNASLLAMRRAVEAMDLVPDLILVDGNKPGKFSSPSVAVVKGDAKSPSIAAASILAKVTRDRMMEELDSEYPQFGFAVHKGYPTKAHKAAVFRYGPSAVHRKSFLSFLEKDREKYDSGEFDKYL